MSPWGRFILEHIGIDARGVFHGWNAIVGAETMWGPETIARWCTSILRRIP